MSKSLNDFAETKLRALEARHQKRVLKDTARGPEMKADELISFTDNDYLGLSNDPRVVDASLRATRDYGAGAGASRLVTGNHPLYRELENRLASWKGTEAALVFGSGYLANSGLIPAFVGKSDIIIADELVHASIHAGIRQSGALVKFFRHNDTDHAQALAKEYRTQGRHALLIVEGVYSMDGDQSPLGPLADIADEYDCWLMVDDAHGVGVLGGGRGTVHETGTEGRVPLMVGTLSKSIGAYGGYLAASRAVCELLTTRARSFVYTTGLPPGVIAAANESLKIMAAEPERCARPMALAKRFTDALGMKAPESPVVPLILGPEKIALDADMALREKGYRVAAFRPPTVPEGQSRLRFSFSATHSDKQVDDLIDAVKALGLVNKGTTE